MSTKTKKKVSRSSDAGFSRRTKVDFAALADNKTLLYLLSAVFVIAFFFYYSGPPEDYDIWFHLKYGEHYVKNLTWGIDHSQFSWTPAKSSWKYVTWIGSSILYLSYKIASVQGLYAVRLLIFAGIFALYLYHIRAIGEEFDINNLTALFLVTIAVAPLATIIKPHLFTMLFFAAAVSIYLYCKVADKNIFYIYPFLFLIWVNTHGEFIVGIAFVTLALAGETVNYLFIKKEALSKRQLIFFAVAVALSYISICINPHGISLPLNIVKTFSSGDKLSDFSLINEYKSRWRYLFPTEDSPLRRNTTWLLVFMEVFSLGFSTYIYKKRRFFDPTLFTLSLVFFFFGMNLARASIFFPLIWLFSISYLAVKAEVLYIKKKFAVISLCVFVLFSIDIFYVALRYYPVKSFFGESFEEHYPRKEVEFIKKTGIPGPIFNDYLTGSYLLWSLYPDYKVFIDTRQSPYFNYAWNDMQILKKEIQRTKPESFISKYPFKTAIINLKEPKILLWLLRSPGWKLAYFDNVAAVLVHKSVYDKFYAEINQVDMGPQRFRDVKNPVIVQRIFNLTLNVFGVDYAAEILNIYKMNVSDFYKAKTNVIKSMESALHRKKTIP